MRFREAYVLSNIWMHLIELNIVQMKNYIVNEQDMKQICVMC